MCLPEAVESLDLRRSAVGTGMWQNGPWRDICQSSTQEQVSLEKGKFGCFKVVSGAKGKLCYNVV